MGDQFNMSGNFQGAILNIKSRLDNVTQTIGALPGVDSPTKDELKQLITQLSEALGGIPQERSEDAEKLSKRVEEVVEELKKPNPDKELVGFNLDRLLNTAKSIATFLPAVLPIATDIANHISMLIH